MAEKSREESRTQPGRNGGTLKVGGTNPGAGRPPDEFKAALKAARDRPSVQKYLQQCLDGKHGPQAMLKALEFTSDRVDGKVPSVTKLEGGAEPLEIVIRKE